MCIAPFGHHVLELVLRSCTASAAGTALNADLIQARPQLVCRVVASGSVMY